MLCRRVIAASMPKRRFPLSRFGFPALTLSSPYSCGSGDNGYPALTPERSGLSPAARSVRLHRVVVKQDGHRAGRGGGVGMIADSMSPGARRSIGPGRAFLRGLSLFRCAGRSDWPRHNHGDTEPAERRPLQFDPSPIGLGKITRDREAEAGAGQRLVPAQSASDLLHLFGL